MIDEKTVDRLFDEGFDCSQIVLGELSDKLGISKEQAYSMASAFGIGMARGSICGAATGALIALGMKYGNVKPGDLSKKSLIFDKREEFLRRFEEANGKLMCPDLLGQKVCTLRDLIETRPTGIYKDCPRFCVNAVRIALEML